MDEVLEALAANFEGHEELRKKLMAAPKFGNDDEYADEIASHIWDWTKRQVLEYRDWEGRRYVIFRQGAAWAAWGGATVAALPNGRKAGTTLADASASPVQNCDVSGPTAVLNSVAKLDPMYMEGPLLNMKFAPGILHTKEGRKKFADMIGTYMDQGGFHVQFNILDRETLLEAKAHPEEHKNLVVRVAGYSAFWGELVPEVQDDIINRTDHTF
jgi:formate C-acetyltransferase